MQSVHFRTESTASGLDAMCHLRYVDEAGAMEEAMTLSANAIDTINYAASKLEHHFTFTSLGGLSSM